MVSPACTSRGSLIGRVESGQASCVATSTIAGITAGAWGVPGSVTSGSTTYYYNSFIPTDALITPYFFDNALLDILWLGCY